MDQDLQGNSESLPTLSLGNWHKELDRMITHAAGQAVELSRGLLEMHKAPVPLYLYIVKSKDFGPADPRQIRPYGDIQLSHLEPFEFLADNNSSTPGAPIWEDWAELAPSNQTRAFRSDMSFDQMFRQLSAVCAGTPVLGRACEWKPLSKNPCSAYLKNTVLDYDETEFLKNLVPGQTAYFIDENGFVDEFVMSSLQDFCQRDTVYRSELISVEDRDGYSFRSVSEIDFGMSLRVHPSY